MTIIHPDHPDFWDPNKFLPMMSVRSKSGRIVPFELWHPQKIIAAGVMRAYKERKWLCHVKPRQEGSSTFFTGIAYQHTAFRSGCRTAILAHKKDTSSYLASMAVRFHQHTPAQIKQKKTPGLKRTLEFPSIDSRLTVDTVRGEEPLRGETIQVLLATEISSWAENLGADAWTAALNAVADDGGIVFAESTPKFHGDQMHQISMDADTPDSKWLKVFIPWTMVESYSKDPPPGWRPTSNVLDYANKYTLTPAQAFWMQTSGLEKCRRDMRKFKAEYPINEVDCWTMVGDAVFDTDRLMEMLKLIDGNTGIAKETKEHETYAPINPDHRYVIAVDPASSWSKRDYTGVVVLDIDTCSVVADFLGHRDAHDLASWLCTLGMKYNKASIYVESNGVGEAVLSHLVANGYRRIYYRSSTSPLSRSAGKTRIPGWHSSMKTKAEAISILQQLILDGSLSISSRRLVQQLAQYRGQWDKLKRDATGGHFDLVAAMSIASWAWRYESGKTLSSTVDKKNQALKNWKRLLRRIDGGSGKGFNTPWGKHL